MDRVNELCREIGSLSRGQKRELMAALQDGCEDTRGQSCRQVIDARIQNLEIEARCLRELRDCLPAKMLPDADMALSRLLTRA